MLIETIHKQKAEAARAKAMSESAEARRAKVRKSRTGRASRIAEKQAQIAANYAAEDAAKEVKEASQKQKK